MADDLARATRALAEQNRNDALDALLAAWPPLPGDRAGYDDAVGPRVAAALAHLDVRN